MLFLLDFKFHLDGFYCCHCSIIISFENKKKNKNIPKPVNTMQKPQKKTPKNACMQCIARSGTLPNEFLTFDIFPVVCRRNLFWKTFSLWFYSCQFYICSLKITTWACDKRRIKRITRRKKIWKNQEHNGREFLIYSVHRQRRF